MHTYVWLGIETLILLLSKWLSYFILVQLMGEVESERTMHVCFNKDVRRSLLQLALLLLYRVVNGRKRSSHFGCHFVVCLCHLVGIVSFYIQIIKPVNGIRESESCFQK